MKNINPKYNKELSGNKVQLQICLIFDWGDTVMRDFIEFKGPMIQWPKVEVIPFIEENLQKLAPYYTLCLGSNAGDSNTSLMVDALKRLGLDVYFDYYFTSKDLGVEKPEPVFFQTIAREAGYEPSQCIVIGNDYLKDISGGKNAGMRTVFLNSKMLEGSFPMADAIIHTLENLDRVIGELVKEL